jgi:energy-coupling factor transporter ATP-binding protein EcfA2
LAQFTAATSVNVRKFVVRASHVEDLVTLGTLTAQAAAFLEAAVASGLNILVAGGTQAGKTTLLNCLATAVPPRERVVTAEEVFELKVAAARRGLPAVPAAQPRGQRGDQAASPGQGGVADATLAHHRRRGPTGGVARPVERIQLGVCS